MENKKVLKNEMLFKDDILDDNYAYCPLPYTIGIYTVTEGNNRRYFFYCNDERNGWVEEKDTFKEALIYARKMYKGMISYYLGMYKNDKGKSKK